MTAILAKLITRSLWEQYAITGRVDRERGIIYGVKVAGTSSPNTHGFKGVSGTVYTLEAYRKALPLYEGVNCNIDHPPVKKPDEVRSAHDRFAWLEDVYVKESGVYGDLHFLDPADPLAVKMMNAAESKPDAYALSHNAVGKGEIKNGKYVILEIPEVRSVDIVSDGGSNRSLFEGRTVKTRIYTVLHDKVLPALKAGRKKRLQRLLETCLTEARSPLMEAADDDDADHRDHLYRAMRASEDAGNDEAAKGIHKLLSPDKRNGSTQEDDEGESVEEADDGDEEKDTEEGTGVEGPGEEGGNEGPDGGKGKGAKESKQRKHLAKGEIMLNEARALAMCKAMELEATANLMEALQGASFDQAMAMLTEIKSYRKRPASSAPRSTNLREAATPLPDGDKNLKAWCDSLRG